MNAAVYEGIVTHQRMRPRRHRFSYRVFWVLLDIDRLADTASSTRLFSHNRPNLFSFRDRDHGPRDGTPLRPWIDGVLADAGLETGGRVRILCFPRMFGFVFDPLSLWFCEDPSGDLSAILYEVHNTFGESHSYLLHVNAPETIEHRWDKRFYVSPFIDMEATYEFTLREPAERLSVAVRQADTDGHLFSASMTGRRVPFSTATLARLFFTHPLMTLKVVAGIHWEALRLWRKGAPYRSRPEAPEPVSVPEAAA